MFAERPLCPPGAKHKSMLEGHSTQMRRGRGKLLSRAGHKSKRIGNKGSINIQNKAFHCQVCEIYVNSETQLKQVTTPGLAALGHRARGRADPSARAPGGWGVVPGGPPRGGDGCPSWTPGSAVGLPSLSRLQVSGLFSSRST